MAEPPKKKHTHTAWVFKREGRRPNQGRWFECGVATQHEDGRMFSLINLLPVGGFNGRLVFVPVGEPPPAVEPEPQRPGGVDDEAEDQDPDI
jgi:hypothetical protein